MIQRPVALGLLLCEQVIVEEKTHNLTPVNCFSRRTIREFPVILPFVLLVILTDGMGTMNLEVVVQELESLDVIYQRPIACNFASPLQEVRGVFRIRCPCPKAGHYQVSLLADNELVSQRKFVLSGGNSP